MRTKLEVVLVGSGGYVIQFTGAPDTTYRLQRAANVTGPWETIDTLTAPSSSVIKYDETNPPLNGAFYRTVQP